MRYRISIMLICFMLPCYAVSPHYGMVVSEKKIAAEIGAHVLRNGGNAIDAAVAVAYALAVIDPCCGNLGGGGFMTIHLAKGQNKVINFREKAPLSAHRNTFIALNEEASRIGYTAVATPGTVLGLEVALQKYGTQPLARLIAPAIQLAEHGYTVTPYDAKLFAANVALFKKNAKASTIFLDHGKPYKAGMRLVQRELAHTLKQIAKEGARYFYHGPIAKTIALESSLHHGLLSESDFKNYSVEILEPVQCQYHGYTILSTPPPSSGGTTLCEMLNILDGFDLRSTPRDFQTIVEAMGYAFNDRNHYLGDPNFIQIPNHLLTTAYAEKLQEKILRTISHNMQSTKSYNEKPHTLHFSVADRYGNAVAVTLTLNGYFGTGIIAGDTGFFLNNEMDDFATHPGMPNQFGLIQQEQNAVASGKRPLSSMTPTIVLKGQQVYLVLGSPGGPRIITAVLQTLINVIDLRMNLANAIASPRFHYQGQPDVIEMEANAFSSYTIFYLKMRGYRVQSKPFSSAVSAILIDQNNNWQGVSDPRRPDGGVVYY